MAATFSVAFTPTPLGASEKIVIQASGPVSPGLTNVPKGRYRTVFVGAAASASPANILSAWESIYGSIATQGGMRVFVRAKIINSDGFAGAELQDTIVIAES